MHHYSLIGTKSYNKAEDFSEPISTDIECKYDLIKCGHLPVQLQLISLLQILAICVVFALLFIGCSYVYLT